MHAFKNVWKWIIDLVQNVRFLRKFNGFETLFWMAMVPIAWVTGLINSQQFLIFISIWALVKASWSSWQASRTEEKEDSD
jgi:hypothetical protein